MAEYQDSLQNYQVVKDAVSINAATECNRLAEENRRLNKWIEIVRQRADILHQQAQALHNHLNPKIKDGK